MNLFAGVYIPIKSMPSLPHIVSNTHYLFFFYLICCKMGCESTENDNVLKSASEGGKQPFHKCTGLVHVLVLSKG